MSENLQEEAGLAGALASLRSILIPAETLEAWAVQSRIVALTHRRLIIAATSGRLLWMHRKLIAGFDLANVRWQDLEDVSLRVGLFTAELTVRAGRPADLASEGAGGSQTYHFPGLRKEQAQSVYRICQAQDQAWREKRRIRELEELRARAGGIQLGGSSAYGGATGNPDFTAGAAGTATPDATRRLTEAKKLLDERLITDSEYEAIKARILSGA